MRIRWFWIALLVIVAAWGQAAWTEETKEGGAGGAGEREPQVVPLPAVELLRYAPEGAVGFFVTDMNRLLASQALKDAVALGSEIWPVAAGDGRSCMCL